MSYSQANQTGEVLVPFDAAKQALGQAGAYAGEQTGEGSGHHTGEGSPVDDQHQQGDCNVQGSVVAQPAQHRASRQFDEDENQAKEYGQTGGEHEKLQRVEGLT